MYAAVAMSMTQKQEEELEVVERKAIRFIMGQLKLANESLEQDQITKYSKKKGRYNSRAQTQ